MVITYVQQLNGTQAYFILKDKVRAKIIYEKHLDGVSIFPNIELILPITKLESLSTDELKTKIDTLITADELADALDIATDALPTPVPKTSVSNKVKAIIPKGRTVGDPPGKSGNRA